MIEEHQLILGKFFAGTASDAEAEAVMEAIDSDDSIGAEAIAQWELDGMMQQLAVDDGQFQTNVNHALAGDDLEAGVLAMQVAHRLKNRARTQAPKRWWPLALAAAVVMAIGIGLVTQFSGSRPAHAVVASVINVTWASGAPQYTTGAELHDQILRVASGRVVLTFGPDDQVVLEGPAELEIKGGRVCGLHAGLLMATTATGFEVITPQGRVVDRGTSFSVHVSKQKETSEVKVLAGQVDVFLGSGDQQQRISLDRDEGVVLSKETEGVSIQKTLDLPHAIFDSVQLAIAPRTTGVFQAKKTRYYLSLNPDKPWMRKLSDTQYRTLKLGRDWKAWEKYFNKKHPGFVPDENPNVFWLLAEDHPFDGRGANPSDDFHDHIFRCVVDPAQRTVTMHPDPGWEIESVDRAWLVSAGKSPHELLSPPGVIQNGDKRSYVLHYGPILERMVGGK